MTIHVRSSDDRGYFDHEWLKTYHTFSFGQYYDPNYKGFRMLRVLNEDRVMPGLGFPLHAHKDMEIFTIVVEGGLAHQDDMANASILRPGRIQLMSAGRGVTHTELNASDKEEVHFLQIWVLPNARNLKPSYQEKFFDPPLQHNQWCLIISSNGREGSLHIHQDVDIYQTTLDKNKELTYELGANRYGWIQIIKGEIELNGIELRSGDGASISQENMLNVKARSPAQLILLDLN